MGAGAPRIAPFNSEHSAPSPSLCTLDSEQLAARRSDFEGFEFQKSPLTATPEGIEFRESPLTVVWRGSSFRSRR